MNNLDTLLLLLKKQQVPIIAVKEHRGSIRVVTHECSFLVTGSTVTVRWGSHCAITNITQMQERLGK